MRLTEGPQVLVGSSMGGWIALILAGPIPGRIAGLVGIAAAPDFTEDAMWAGMDAPARAKLLAGGRIELPSEYGDAPYAITRRLIEDGRRHLVLRTPLELDFAVRLLHGTADRDVDLSVALRLLAHATGPDIRLNIVKDADHRFSAPENLELIARTVEETLLGIAAGASRRKKKRPAVGAAGRVVCWSCRQAWLEAASRSISSFRCSFLSLSCLMLRSSAAGLRCSSSMISESA